MLLSTNGSPFRAHSSSLSSARPMVRVSALSKPCDRPNANDVGRWNKATGSVHERHGGSLSVSERRSTCFSRRLMKTPPLAPLAPLTHSFVRQKALSQLPHHRRWGGCSHEEVELSCTVHGDGDDKRINEHQEEMNCYSRSLKRKQPGSWFVRILKTSKIMIIIKRIKSIMRI